MLSSTEDSLNECLIKIVSEACLYPAKSVVRQEKLTQIVQLVEESGKLWKENTPFYEEAKQETWLYFCLNPKKYNPARASVITWLNNHLKWRLKEFRRRNAKEAAKTIVSAISGNGVLRSEQSICLLDNLPASPDIPPILEEVLKWAETDPNGELRGTHIRDRPNVTCQILILRRLPPSTHWGAIAEEFNLPISTVISFYHCKVLPRLREFGLSQGYL